MPEIKEFLLRKWIKGPCPGLGDVEIERLVRELIDSGANSYELVRKLLKKRGLIAGGLKND